jgi:hypothetical protein
MASRREFLQIGVAALALPISARAGVKATGAPGESAPAQLYKVIYDERHASGRAFASEVKRLGASLQAMKGDITDFWFNELDARWKK